MRITRVVREAVSTQEALGRRIGDARDDAGITQADLARALGVDPSAVTRMESGDRKVSATELVAIAGTLGRPIDWFVYESPPAVLSRRQEAGVTSRSLDLEIESLARDVDFVVREGLLRAPTRTRERVPADHADAERLALRSRQSMDRPDGPLLDLQAACETLGVVAVSLELGAGSGDGAYVEVGETGVALINGSLDAGRRRFNLAHELGHHLVGDAFAAELTAGPAAETERLLNTFAAHLLLPRAAVTALWNERSINDRRLAVVAIAARFRVSWTVACNQLRDFDLIRHEERATLVDREPRAGEFLAAGERWEPELVAPSVPPVYAKQIVNGYRTGNLTPQRTVELLRHTISTNDLPPRFERTIEDFRRELQPLP